MKVLSWLTAFVVLGGVALCGLWLAELRGVQMAIEKEMIGTSVANSSPKTFAAPGEKDRNATSSPARRVETQIAPHGEMETVRAVDQQLKWGALKRMVLADEYDAFFRRLGLSEEESGELLDALVTRYMNVSDIEGIGVQRKVLRSSAIAEARTSAEKEFNVAVSAVVGEEGVYALRSFERTLPARRFAAEIAGVAALARLHLSRSQMEDISAAIAASSEKYISGGVVSFNNIDWTLVEGALEHSLTPQQLALFRRVDVPGPNSRWYPQVRGSIRAGKQTGKTTR